MRTVALREFKFASCGVMIAMSNSGFMEFVYLIEFLGRTGLVGLYDFSRYETPLLKLLLKLAFEDLRSLCLLLPGFRFCHSYCSISRAHFSYS